MRGDSDDIVLARLPNGVLIASSLIPDESPPRHVYRLRSADGAILSEHATLVELIELVELIDSAEDHD